MKKRSIVAKKKISLAEELFELKDKWPVNARMEWALENDCNPDTIRNKYFSGDPDKIANIPFAEKLLEAIQEHLKGVEA